MSSSQGSSAAESGSGSALPVAYHVPSGALEFNTYAAAREAAAAAAASSAQQARRPPIPHPGGLETLDEVSHVNALHLATGRAPAGLGRTTGLSADVERAAEEALNSLPPCQSALALARAGGYNLIAIELTNERWKELWERMCLDSGAMDTADGMVRSSSRSALSAGPSSAAVALHAAEEWRRAPAFQRAEVNITRVEESEGVVAFLSQWLELDSADEGVRLDSEIALQQEVAYASHLGISQVILPAPSSDPARRAYLPDYARAVANCITAPAPGTTPPAGQWITLSVRLPVASPYEASRSRRGGPAPMSPSADDWAWETWGVIQQACAYSSRVQLTLDVTHPLPGAPSVARWNSEPVSGLLLPSTAFLANAKGFPVLPKAMQGLLRGMVKRRPVVILSDVDDPPVQHTRGGSAAYLQYVRHIEKTAPADTPLDVFGKGYSDWLQAPLQPLMDNLESSTYEVFERDPVKYALYEEAVYKALLDRQHGGHASTSIWVCGAGRGPLVARCLAASKRAKARVHVTALEKNANALVVLQERQMLEWGADLVSIQYGDMRQTAPPREKADIVVSELLGSFGDNELSPECLDGAMRFLKPNGISIPASYTSYLTPISSSKLHGEVLGNGANARIIDSQKLKSVETPYVVLLQAVTALASDGGRGGWEAVQAAWTFQHGPAAQVTPAAVCDANGLPLTNAHNVRTSAHTFHIPHAGICHGFAGYFDAHLYADVNMSIHPDPARHSKDMLSWFPIFFPLKDPLYLPAGAELDVHLWRLSSSRKVWYEWYAEAFLPLPPIALAGLGGSLQPSSTAQGVASASSADTVHGAAASSNSGTSGGGGGAGGSAFQNAPATPSLLSVHTSNGGSSQPASRPHSFAASASVSGTDAAIVRVKTAMSALMNPGGRSSWIGL